MATCTSCYWTLCYAMFLQIFVSRLLEDQGGGDNMLKMFYHHD